MPEPFRSHLNARRGFLAALLGVMTVAATGAVYAGDILRGSAVTTTTRGNKGGSKKAGETTAALVNQNAQDRLARTTQALQSVKAMQAAARSAALGANNLGMDPNTPGVRLPDVPDGLTAGGLDISGVPIGALTPRQSGGGNGVTVTVQQTAQQALLNWNTFNVGKNTTLKFDQSAGGSDKGKWIAFNRVMDPSRAPSQILGSIKADGQVYIINQNGIIFGGASQVNVHTLVASSLPMNDNLLGNGILNNPDLQFLFTALPLAAGNKGTPAFIPTLRPDGLLGDITVQPGAVLTAPSSAAKTGGRIALIAPNVKNAGTISTPDGQTILAAGLQVAMAAHKSSDASLRGLDIYVGEVGTGGTVSNVGIIDIPRASLTMAGKDVRQFGVIDSTTSVSLNGRIDLVANYNVVSNANYDPDVPANGDAYFFQSTGNVTLGAGSVTRILPEVWSDEKAVGTELALPSQINLQGKVIHLEANASILAPNAAINLRAGNWNLQATSSQFVYPGGQIYLDSGALIDAAGTTNVNAPLAQNILSVQLRGSELANSPLQRDQLLRAVMLTIDARKTGYYNGRFWVGTPLGDATGFLNLIERNVGQLTTAGGSVNLQAGGSVVLNKGSIIDVSGGWVKYEGGMVKTTKVRYGSGVINIEDATPDRLYGGVYTAQFTKTHAKWGVSKTYTNPLALNGGHYEEAYLHGADGGKLNITAPAMALDGTLAGLTVAGPRQQRSSNNTSALPGTSSLSLAFQSQLVNGTSASTIYPSPLQVIFQKNTEQSSVAPFSLDALGDPLPLTAERSQAVFLSPELLSESGFGSLTVSNEDGTILVPEETSLIAAAGGSISLAAANIDVRGQVISPGGALSFKVYNISPYEAAVIAGSPTPVTPPPNVGRGIFTLGSRALLSAAGSIVDDRATSAMSSGVPLQLAGGSITIDSYTSNLAEGGVIDVSGGIMVAAGGKKTYGNAGSIVIKTGQDLSLSSVIGGKLSLGSLLKGYSRLAGGSLALQAGLIQVGGQSAHPDALLIQPDFFNQGGFSRFKLSGLGASDGNGGAIPGLQIVDGTQINPVVASVIGIPHSQGGKGIALVPTVLPVESRSPLSLTFEALGVKDAFSNATILRGDLVMGENSLLQTGPLGAVSLSGNTVAVLGSIFAPGGKISVSGAANSLPLFADQQHALTTVYMGSRSVLSAAGTSVLTPDPYGRRLGTVLPGGRISISGNIVAAAGALLDVSGASDTFDFSPLATDVNAAVSVPANSGLTAPLFAQRTVPMRVDSDGGAIVLQGGQMLLSDATLLGVAGGPNAQGGSLSISSGRFYPQGVNPTVQDSTLIVRQSGQNISTPPPDNAGAIGQAVLAAGGTPTNSRGYFSVDTFARGGFSALSLNGVVEFQGAVSINADRMIRVADGGVLYANNEVRLSAPYVALGMAFLPPVTDENLTGPFGSGSQAITFPPTFGPGRLIVSASLIDVGTLSLQNIGYAALQAENGDIRGNGIFNIAGDLLLRAAQVYPVTASRFTIAAYDHGGLPGSITVEAAGVRSLPFSAGGELNIYASVINQHGVLRAPFGTINLGWDGTGVAPTDLLTGSTLPFPVTQQLTLGAGSITSVSGIDTKTGRGVLIPYGTSKDGNSWIDPYGEDISGGGLVEKAISLSARNLSADAGSTIDLRGGGDLYAYRWVEGLGGTVDILASSSSYAILPDYDAGYSPLAPFTGSDPGYVNGSLSPGDKVYLGASNGLAAGYYTLLPARYALLPGAFLVTPQAGAALGSISLPDGSSIVSGYRFNDLSGGGAGAGPATRFEVASASVIRSRAQYDDYLASDFLKNSALALETPMPRLPIDAGHLVLQATQSMALAGQVLAQGAAGGRGGLVDVASSSNILIGNSPTQAAPGELFLNSSLLSGFGAESLLIGGVRYFDEDGTKVTVRTGKLTVSNAGSSLSAPDLILAANQELTLAPGAVVESAGSLSGADTLLLGDEDVAGSGNGLLVRVSADPSAQIVRAGVAASTIPHMNIGAGSRLSGESLILDSTYATNLDPSTDIQARFISLNSGQISLQFNNPGALQPTAGLVLAGGALQDLQSASSLSLLSYSSIDIYGTGGFSTIGNLAMHAAEIRGFNNGGGTVSFNVGGELLLDNSPGRASLGPVGGLSGTLEFNADVIRLGINQLNVDQFSQLRLNAPGGILVNGTGGLTTQGSLLATTSLLTTGKSATYALTAGGSLVVQTPVGAQTTAIAGGLGGSLTLQGASINVTSDIVLPSGLLSLRATSGDVQVGGLLDVGGTRQSFYDVVKYTDAGRIDLIANNGSVLISPDSVLNLAARSGGGNGGALNVSTPNGSFTLNGTLFGSGGDGARHGAFSLDVASLPSLASINAVLNAASLNDSRAFRVRSGNVLIDGLATARAFSLSADQGSITVSGVIDASGETGGSINLQANKNVTLLAGSKLTVAGENFSNAGKGGEVTLEAGSQRNGVVGVGSLDIQTGSIIDLSVAAKIAGDANTPGSSAWFGQFSGKLHLRAPQNATFTDLLVNPINGTIVDASSILVEGYRLYDLTASGGTITSAVQSTINSNAQSFLGNAGSTTAGYTAMLNRLLANNAGLASVVVLAPGAEIINRTGDLTLGTTASTATSDWNLATFRYGAKSAPGVLTLRAAGNLVFYNAVSDGFATAAYNSLLLGQNALLPVNTQSWSYRFSAGADLTAADYGQVLSTASLGANAGYVKLGKDNGVNIANSNGSNNSAGTNALTSLALTNRFQVIRTGSGDINIHSGRSIQLLNHFATIYTVGTRVADYTMGSTFDVPVLNQTGGNVTLGAIQQSPTYAAQYTMAGGDVVLKAQENIEHLTLNAGVLVADSQNQLPNNWLYRRGFVNDAGVFGRARNATTGDIASTSWWVDFSNFFQGVGTLGGGDVTLIAGRDISNVDAVAATNARMTGKDASGNAVAPNTANLLELGGGDLLVQAGRNIDAGVYYVERGQGTLTAGNDIITNSTRSPSMVLSPSDVLDSHTWLPTTLFLGKGGFDVNARGNVLLGPTANLFLLPEGVNNSFWYKSTFSTYSEDSYVNAASLGGSVTLRAGTTLQSNGAGEITPILYPWLQNMQLLTSNPASASYYRPWLRLNETSVEPFTSLVSLLPGTLRATAFSGDVNLVGNLTLSPAAKGTLELLSAGAINCLQPNGQVFLSGGNAVSWGTSTITVSDADPAAIPGVASPFAYQSIVGTVSAQARTTREGYLDFIGNLFAENGSTTASIQSKQNLHSPGLLHKDDESPLRLYAGGGNISGLTLFSPKFSQVFAAQDISDVSFYIQNVDDANVSVVASGRDIIPYNANTPLRVAANRTGNIPNGSSGPLAGDIQISGPGTLEVLAGRHLDLGTGLNNADGTGTGITSIGNGRNPYMSFAGADLVVGAGVGMATGLADGVLNYEEFLATYGDKYLAELSDVDGLSATGSAEEKARLALKIFYLVLRDAGRNFAVQGSGAYDEGYAAIASLFGNSTGTVGNILTRSRDIRTKSGGSIDILIPHGGLTLAEAAIGNPLAPPGIITESGGSISIFARDSVDIGIGRIFTLRGGNEILWSSEGDIAAGSAAKTVKSAPPTRVLIDPQSGDVQTDLAGLATGGGIGVLATVEGVEPGDVDLIAPVGTVDAGDAGIRVTGNLNIAATQVLNASNISVGGATSGVPTAAVVAAPNIAGLTAASTSVGAGANAANEVANQARNQAQEEEPQPSIITVEVLGYGGGEDSEG